MTVTADRPGRAASPGRPLSDSRPAAEEDATGSAGWARGAETAPGHEAPRGARAASPTTPVRARPPRSITRRRRQPWVSTVDAALAAPAPGPASALPRAPFVILVLVLVIVGVLGVLVLNTKINEGAFRIDDLDTKQNSLDTQQQELERQLADKEAPANLDSAAQGLGLVPAGQPGFVNPDGTVVGTPQPAQASAATEGGLTSDEQDGQ